MQIYRYRQPDTEKFLEYSLRAERLRMPERQGLQVAFYSYLALAFENAGFFDEAEEYLNKSVEIDPDYFFPTQVKVILLCDRDSDYRQAKEELMNININTFKENINYLKTELNWLMGRTCYFMRDYECACRHYQKLVELREANNRVSHISDNVNYAYVLSVLGRRNAGIKYINELMEHLDSEIKGLEKIRRLAEIYAFRGETEAALEQMRIFLDQPNYKYQFIREFRDNPLYDNMRHLPGYRKILTDMETKFWSDHERIKADLKEKGLL